MPKFSITTTFSLATTIEPDSVRTDEQFDLGDGEITDDRSYFDSSEVECSGGQIVWEVEAADEDAAEALAEDAVYDGAEVTDYNSLTWGVTDVRHEIERVIEPMTLSRARDILTSYADSVDDEEVGEAVGFVFAHLDSLETRLHETNQRINGLVDELHAAREIPSLASLAAEIVNTLPDSGAPTE